MTAKETLRFKYGATFWRNCN